MTPLELIKEGILNDDMEQVILGYKSLTGESISRGSEEEREPEEGEVQETPVQEDVREEKSKDLDFSIKRSKNDSKSKYAKAEAIQSGENKFVDDGVEASEVTTPEVRRTTRRPPVDLLDVTCHVCGKTEQINPQLKSGEFYRCSRCIGG